MNEFAARISRVRMKSGGADVTIVEGWLEPEEGTCEQMLTECAREASDRFDMNAFFLVTIHESGNVLFSHRIDPECSMATSLIPAYVAELIRRHALNKNDSQQVFRDMFEWVE